MALSTSICSPRQPTVRAAFGWPGGLVLVTEEAVDGLEELVVVLLLLWAGLGE